MYGQTPRGYATQVKCYNALEELCRADRDRPGAGLFIRWHSAAEVAEKAGVSPSTARKYLDRLSNVQRHRFPYGDKGYRVPMF